VTKSTQFLMVAILFASILAGCKPKIQEPCPVFPEKDGYTHVTSEGGLIKLKLPKWVNVSPTYDCKHARSFDVNFWWDKGELHPMGLYFPSKSDVQGGTKAAMVYIGAHGFRKSDEWKQEMERRIRPWQMTGAIPHKFYPLDMYPKFYWESEHEQPKQNPYDIMWGIRGTQDPITGYPFKTTCSIVPVDKKDQTTATQGVGSFQGDSKCMGTINVVKGDVNVNVTVYVWGKGFSEIDKIYNAAVVEIDKMIMEE
jgi:hypothetical protein